MNPPAPEEVRFELSVQPQSETQPWHATLNPSGRPERLEFDSPLELARHLASLGGTTSSTTGRR